jgi:hypothetical protein
VVKSRQSQSQKMGFMFNIDGGYLEGLCRGFKCGILKQSDYLNLVQCETLEGKNTTYFELKWTLNRIVDLYKLLQSVS